MSRIGNWDVSEGGKAAGVNRIDRILEGCALLENWTGAGGKMVLSGAKQDKAGKTTLNRIRSPTMPSRIARPPSAARDCSSSIEVATRQQHYRPEGRMKGLCGGGPRAKPSFRGYRRRQGEQA
jgi:hypothetical protein